MKRQIKFRAFVPYLNEMIQPCYAEIYQDGTFNVGRTPIWAETINDKNDDIVLMQYTGLKSKSGAEIYEGDVCTKMISPDENNRAPRELYRGEIVYHYGGFCLSVDGYYYPISRQHGVIDVLGNIFEHPELLTPTAKP